MKSSRKEMKHEAQHNLCRALQVYMGLGGVPVAVVEENTGICRRNLYSYQSGDATPPFHVYLRLCQFFGSAFTNMTLQPFGYEVWNTEKGGATAEEEMAVITKSAAQLADMLSDGKFSSREKAQRKQALSETVEFLQKRVNAM